MALRFRFRIKRTRDPRHNEFTYYDYKMNSQYRRFSEIDYSLFVRLLAGRMV